MLKLDNAGVAVIVGIVYNRRMLITVLGKSFEFKMNRAIRQGAETIIEKNIRPSGINQCSIESLAIQVKNAVFERACRFKGVFNFNSIFGWNSID